MASNAAWTLLILAGLANATFGLPMKYVRRWEWENTWAAWTVLALICAPVVMAFSCIPSLPTVYRETGLQAIAVVFLFGAGWGLAQVLFGKAMHAIGIGLTFSIVLGLSAAAGSVLPMLRIGIRALDAAATMRIIEGLALVVLGVAVCAEAGRRRERARTEDARRSGSFVPGLAMALSSGLLASMMNLGVAFGGPLAARASAHGASQANGVYAIWLPLLVGGAIPNIAYCAYLLRGRKTWALYRGASQALNIGLAATMAILWFFSTALYGVASHALGAWGVVLAWPVFMSVIVIGAGLIGIFTGEWRDCGRTPPWFQAAGILLLVLAIVSFSRAQSALQNAGPRQTSALQHGASVSLSEVYVR
ncbi:MAG TPA: L-rhamnose/proton symporter RhaT [Terracidiphilus sp.]|nr:L-rhamnose/proton symporter RhaT [Terracidiphilus sp.]